MFDWIGDITGWFNPKERMKAKRIKRDALEAERAKLMKPKKCSAEAIRRVMKIDEELKIINRDLGN